MNRSVQPQNAARNASSSFLECLNVSSLTAARASIKSLSMSLLINIITKTALSVVGLVLYHPLREPATGVTRPSVDSSPQAGTEEAGGGEWVRGQLLLKLWRASML